MSQFRFPNISHAIKTDGFKKIDMLYNQQYKQVGNNVFVDVGVARKIRRITPAMYGKTPVEEQFTGNKSDDELEQAILDRHRNI